jgi:hypothetical protein
MVELIALLLVAGACGLIIGMSPRRRDDDADEEL